MQVKITEQYNDKGQIIRYLIYAYVSSILGEIHGSRQYADTHQEALRTARELKKLKFKQDTTCPACHSKNIIAVINTVGHATYQCKDCSIKFGKGYAYKDSNYKEVL